MLASLSLSLSLCVCVCVCGYTSVFIFSIAVIFGWPSQTVHSILLFIVAEVPTRKSCLGFPHLSYLPFVCKDSSWKSQNFLSFGILVCLCLTQYLFPQLPIEGNYIYIVTRNRFLLHSNQKYRLHSPKTQLEFT